VSLSGDHAVATEPDALTASKACMFLALAGEGDFIGGKGSCVVCQFSSSEPCYMNVLCGIT